MTYQIIFHSGNYKSVDSEASTYEQAFEIRDELRDEIDDLEGDKEEIEQNE